MTSEKVKEIIDKIGLALNITHNTVTTDIVGVEPKEDYSWRVDNTKEINLLKILEDYLINDTDNYP